MKPGRPSFILILLWMVLGGAAFFSEPVYLIWFLAGLCLLPFIAADALLLCLLTDRLKPERTMPLSLAQGETVKVTITLRRSARPLLSPRILIFDLFPSVMDCEAFPAKLDVSLLKKGTALVFSYTLVPRERGPWRFAGIELLASSPLRFWQLKIRHNNETRGRSYPDFKRIARGKELRGLMENPGQKEIRRRGQGLEFMSLRNYQEGDPIKAIDWQATSRRQKLIIREYQEEQDQQVLFIIDSGYRLPEQQFDGALHGLLLLSYAALKHGDTVGAQSFGAEDRWFAPRKGMSTLTSLMNSFYDLHSNSSPSSPFSALETALARLHRRTFIILVSNFREEDGESLSWILPRIRRRHLLLLVSFREAVAERLARRDPVKPAYRPAAFSSFTAADETLDTAAAFSYLASRRRLYQSWEHLGLLTLETTEEKISSELINAYLTVKRSGKL
jgi:uncharacterized protein (DUF58 family)